MNKAKKIGVLFFAATVIIACSNNTESSENAAVEISKANLTTVDYAIEGMVCAMGCAATIEKDVSNIAGVVNASVDYQTEKAHFEFDKSVISEQEIISKIEQIAEGQYKVKDWLDDGPEEELESEEVDVSEESQSSMTNVSLPRFKIPNLFTLLLDQI
jgi:mercuric ion binding protein